MVNYKLYQNHNENSEANGKWFARPAYGETVDMETVSQKIQDNITAKAGDVYAVLKEMGNVLKDEIQRGNRVKIDGLGVFKIGLSSTGVLERKQFSRSNIRCARILFQPESMMSDTGKRVKKLLNGVRFAESSQYMVDDDEDAPAVNP